MNVKRSLLVIITIQLLFLMMFTDASAQVWDNRWFKIKGRANGFMVNDQGNLSRTAFHGASYIYFYWDDANYRYNLRHWVKNSDGNWDSFNGILPLPIGNNEVLWRDIYTRLQDGDNWIWVYAVTRVKIRLDDSNTIEHARFVTMGCESPMGSIDGQNFGGKCKLRGKMISPSELPFTP
jgi:hypothetical protein